MPQERWLPLESVQNLGLYVFPNDEILMYRAQYFKHWNILHIPCERS